MTYELKHGKALVIIGPQGCGKSKLAREIAGAHGVFIEIDAADMRSPLMLGAVLAQQPDVLIIDNAQRVSDHLEALIANEYVLCQRRGRKSITVKTPRIIICGLNLDVDAHSSRFDVVAI